MTFVRLILDVSLLVGAALLVCALSVGAFVFAEVHHLNPMWVFLPLMAAAFLAGVGWDYRKEFKSVAFLTFFCGWAVLHVVVFVAVVGSYGWLYWIPTVVVEQAFFYMSAYWLFGLQPPPRRWRKG